MIVVSLAALAVFVFVPDVAEEYTAGLRPTQFYDPLPPDLVAADLGRDYEQVFGVAHNSGDSVAATLEALAHGADAIEIDVVSLDGTLYSSHAPPLPWIGRRVFRGPSLETIWTAAAQTDLVKFDLKESSPAFHELVRDFVAVHRRRQRVVVASPHPAAHRFFADRMPDVARFLSVGDREGLAALRADPELAALIDGVTIRETLVDAETARWFHDHELRVLAWTVDELDRANELIRLGVDAITTDNRALLALFGGQQRGEGSLDDATGTPAPGDAASGSGRGAPADLAQAAPACGHPAPKSQILASVSVRGRRRPATRDPLALPPPSYGLL